MGVKSVPTFVMASLLLSVIFSAAACGRQPQPGQSFSAIAASIESPSKRIILLGRDAAGRLQTRIYDANFEEVDRLPGSNAVWNDEIGGYYYRTEEGALRFHKYGGEASSSVSIPTPELALSERLVKSGQLISHSAFTSVWRVLDPTKPLLIVCIVGQPSCESRPTPPCGNFDLSLNWNGSRDWVGMAACAGVDYRPLFILHSKWTKWRHAVDYKFPAFARSVGWFGDALHIVVPISDGLTFNLIKAGGPSASGSEDLEISQTTSLEFGAGNGVNDGGVVEGAHSEHSYSFGADNFAASVFQTADGGRRLCIKRRGAEAHCAPNSVDVSRVPYWSQLRVPNLLGEEMRWIVRPAPNAKLVVIRLHGGPFESPMLDRDFIDLAFLNQSATVLEPAYTGQGREYAHADMPSLTVTSEEVTKQLLKAMPTALLKYAPSSEAIVIEGESYGGLPALRLAEARSVSMVLLVSPVCDPTLEAQQANSLSMAGHETWRALTPVLVAEAKRDSRGCKSRFIAANARVGLYVSRQDPVLGRSQVDKMLEDAKAANVDIEVVDQPAHVLHGLDLDQSSIAKLLSRLKQPQ